MKNELILLDIVAEKFKGKRANIIKNGQTIKIKRSYNNRTICMYNIPSDTFHQINTLDKTELMYIETFKECIEKWKQRV